MVFVNLQFVLHLKQFLWSYHPYQEIFASSRSLQKKYNHHFTKIIYFVQANCTFMIQNGASRHRYTSQSEHFLQTLFERSFKITQILFQFAVNVDEIPSFFADTIPIQKFLKKKHINYFPKNNIFCSKTVHLNGPKSASFWHRSHS